MPVGWVPVTDNISTLAHHPKRVLEQIRALAADLDRVDYSVNLNSLVRARQVSMRAIWTCLESGELVADHLHLSEPEGDYAKLVCHVEGRSISVDILVCEDGVQPRLLVLWADEIED
jgi:hypothetical protein